MDISVLLMNYSPNRMGGTETFIAELLPEINRLRSDVNLETYTSGGINFRGLERPSVQVSATALPDGQYSRGLHFLKSTLSSKSFWRSIPQSDIDFYPLTAAVPRARNRKRTVVTIHDLQHRDFPMNFSIGQHLYRKLTYENPWKNNTHVVSVSNFTKTSITKHLGISPEKITTIYPGINHNLFRPESASTQSSKENFIFYPARLLPHKNHRLLFAAFEIVQKYLPRLELFLSGSKQDARNHFPPGVRHLGHISNNDLASLYRSSKLMVFPSSYEGFGFPPLEAMASACPVLLSNSGSIPEIAGEGSRYFDPATSPQELADLILRSLNLNSEHIEYGLERSKEFTWERSAENYLQLFDQISSANNE